MLSSWRRSFLKKISVPVFALTTQAVEGIKLLRVEGTVPLAETVVNRGPLAPNRFYSLPLGAIRPKGWLLKQLRIQANGTISTPRKLFATGASMPRAGEGDNIVLGKRSSM
jgi:hypothetical protein